MAMLSKDQILAADDLKRRTVNVPEWGGSVVVKTMTGEERDSYEAEVIRVNGKEVSQNRENVRARLLVRTIVDDRGNRLFTDAEFAALGKKSGGVLDRLFDVATELNKISAADVAELAKNSDAGPSAGSGS